MKALWLLPLASIALVGCTGGSEASSASSSTTTAPAKGEKSALKVALLTPGPVSDAGWNAMAYDGLTAIKDQLGAEVNNQEATGTQIKDAMRAYAQKGYTLVFGHGFEYNEPEIEVAKDFPNTVFVSSSGSKFAKNAGTFRFYLEQGFYLAGEMAAMMSKTGSIGMIGGDNVPSIKSTFKAFEAGAKAARPDIKVITVFTGNGKDVAAAKQAALNVIGQGADFLIHQANNGAQGVFDAAKEKGIYAFGANADQNDNASGVVIASAVIRARPAFLDLAKSVKDGKFQGAVILMGMDKGAIEFVINPKLKDKIPAKVAQALDDSLSKIKSGALVVPKDPLD